MTSLKKKFLQKRLEASIIFIITLFAINTAFTFMVLNYLERYESQQAEILQLEKDMALLRNQITSADVGIRGFMLTDNEKLLGAHRYAIKYYPTTIERIREGLDQQQYYKAGWDEAIAAVIRYMEITVHMKNLQASGKHEEALAILKKNEGSKAYSLQNAYFNDVSKALALKKQELNSNYDRWILGLFMFQLFLLMLATPLLIITIHRLKKNKRERIGLYRSLSEHNRKYIFDDGLNQETVITERKVIKAMERNLKKATHFISEISKGNYTIEWEGFNPENKTLNQQNLSGELLNMRDQMSGVKKKEATQKWRIEGVTKIAEIVREQHRDLVELASATTIAIVKYLNANQGALFIKEEQEGKQVLKLYGAYAFSRKKFLQKSIPVGDGIAGQVFLEGEPTYITSLPKEYITITSGLGDHPPRSLAVIPLKHNQRTYGVLEIASFQEIAPHQMRFLTEVAEIIASGLQTVQVNQETQALLKKAQSQGSQLQAQEEEMRQNMEELEATHEEMQRKEQEMSRLLAESQAKEEKLREQLSNMKNIPKTEATK